MASVFSEHAAGRTPGALCFEGKDLVLRADRSIPESVS
jgi:hypothetical protein